jgi:O-antigen/teichoic acid export membrane protein
MTKEGKSNQQDSASANQGLHLAVRSGTRAVILAHVLSQLVSLASLAFLYRLISQQDFGLWGMLMPAVLLLRMLGTIPLGVAAVQQQELSSGKASSLFWVGLATSAIAGVLTASCGPLLALAYDAKDLVGLAAALGLTPVLLSLGSQHQALLERKLRLGPLAALRLLAQAMGAAAGIAAAIAGWGVWSLVVQQYVELSTLSIGLWRLESWRPNGPRSGEPVRELLRFGGFHGLSGLLIFVAQNIDKVILAFLLRGSESGRAVVGMYTQAFNLTMRPVYAVIAPVKAIVLPALSRARTDPETFRALLTNFYRMIAVVLVPCGIGLFVVAEDVMRIMAPDWEGAGLILRALALAITVQGFFDISGSVFSSVGRADLWFAGAIAATLLLVQGYGFGYWLGSSYGPPEIGPALGLAWSYTVVGLTALFIPYLYFCLRSVGVPLSGFLVPLRWIIITSVSMGLVTWWLRATLLSQTSLPIAARLAVTIAAGVLVYGLLARREVRWLLGQFRIRGPDEYPANHR